MLLVVQGRLGVILSHVQHFVALLSCFHGLWSKVFQFGKSPSQDGIVGKLRRFVLEIFRFAFSFEFLGKHDSFANLKFVHLAPLDFEEKSTSALVKLGMLVDPSRMCEAQCCTTFMAGPYFSCCLLGSLLSFLLLTQFSNLQWRWAHVWVNNCGWLKLDGQHLYR